MANLGADDRSRLAEMLRHTEIYGRTTRLLKRWRKKLWLPPTWNVQIEIFCPCPEKDGKLGSVDWGYRPNDQFLIQLRCDLTPEELEWVLAHELLEALLSDYGEFCLNFFSESENESWGHAMDREHRRVRDHLIEHLLHAFFGGHSPARFAEYPGEKERQRGDATIPA